MKKDKYQIAIIGAGFGANVHFPVFQNHNKCQVKGILASSQASTNKAAQQLGIKGYQSAKEIMNDSDIDIISIAIPPVAQAELIHELVACQKHLFLEKPLGILEIANLDQLKKNTAIHFEFPDTVPFIKAKESLQSVGPLRHIIYRWDIENFSYKSKKLNWKVDPDKGGGTLNNFASHALYNIEWLFGPLSKIRGTLINSSKEFNCDSIVQVNALTQNQIPISLTLSANSTLSHHHSIQIFGEQGCLSLINTEKDYIKGFELLLKTRESEAEKCLANISAPDVDGRILAMTPLVDRFITAIESNTPFTPGILDGLRNQKILDTIFKNNSDAHWASI